MLLIPEVTVQDVIIKSGKWRMLRGCVRLHRNAVPRSFNSSVIVLKWVAQAACIGQEKRKEKVKMCLKLKGNKSNQLRAAGSVRGS